MSAMPAFSRSFYARLMGVDDDRLAGRSAVPLSDILYYAYHKGFWAYLRGLVYRPRLRGCGGRFFLGRHTRILFPGQLSVARNVAIGDYVYMNCYGRSGVRLGADVRIREFGSILVTSQLSHPGVGLTVGDRTYIGPHSVLGAGGGVTVGQDVTCGAYVQLLAENHAFDDPSLPIAAQGVTRGGIDVGDGCWLGNAVIVLDGVRVGAHAVIGAGSVVTHDVPAFAVAVGNPARVIRLRAG